MPITPLQIPQANINSQADFSPLERIGQLLAKQREEAEAGNLIANAFGGPQQQPQQSGGFLSDLGRRLGFSPPAAPQAAPQTYQPAGPPRFSNSDDLMANYGGAISKAESGGKYDVLGPTTRTGDRAYGKYQVMGANIPDWTKAATGTSLTPQEFLADPAAQDAVFKHRFGMYAQKYGPENAAKAWFAGERGMNNPNARDQLGTSVASYADQFRRNANLPAEVMGGRSMAQPSPLDTAEWPAGPRGAPVQEVGPGGPSPLDTADYPAGPVGAPSTDISAQSRGAAPGSVVGRAVNNLASPAPTATAGIGRDQLAALYRNPLTRPLATAFLQKQLDPGTYTFQQVGDKLVRTNSRTGNTDVVMSDTKPFIVGEHALVADPNAPSGYRDIAPPSQKPIGVKEGEQMIVADPNSPTGYRDITPGGGTQGKITREIKQRTDEALAKGYDQSTADYYGLNGKLPKEDLSATEMKAVTDAQKQALSGQDVLDNLARMKELSPKAWSGWGASKRASIANALLPNEMIPQGAVDAKELSNLALQNVAGQAKAVFGARLAVAEVKLLNEIETTPEMSDRERQAIYVRIERLIKRHVDAASSEAEGIRNKTYFKPGSAKAGEAAPDPLGIR